MYHLAEFLKYYTVFGEDERERVLKEQAEDLTSIGKIFLTASVVF